MRNSYFYNTTGSSNDDILIVVVWPMEQHFPPGTVTKTTLKSASPYAAGIPATIFACSPESLSVS